MLNPLDWPQVLFVAGPDVARDPAVIVRTVISAVGIATAWYGSIYPFLANSKLLDRATEAMELSDAGMPTDLSWLSDMSIPKNDPMVEAKHGLPIQVSDAVDSDFL